MKNILLGNTGISVSRLGAGVLPMGPNQRNMAVEEGAAVVRHALDAGINFIDTAQYYRAYPYIRQALAGRNDDVVICSKSLAPDHEGMAAAIEEARRSLDRDVIEIFLLHEVRAGQFEQRQGAWDCLCDAREKGIVKAVGISTHDCDVTALMAQESQCGGDGKGHLRLPPQRKRRFFHESLRWRQLDCPISESSGICTWRKGYRFCDDRVFRNKRGGRGGRLSGRKNAGRLCSGHFAKENVDRRR